MVETVSWGVLTVHHPTLVVKPYFVAIAKVQRARQRSTTPAPFCCRRNRHLSSTVRLVVSPLACVRRSVFPRCSSRAIKQSALELRVIRGMFTMPCQTAASRNVVTSGDLPSRCSAHLVIVAPLARAASLQETIPRTVHRPTVLGARLCHQRDLA